MSARAYPTSELDRKRSLKKRMLLVHLAFGVVMVLIVARLMELQLVKGEEYKNLARDQQSAGVELPAKRGQILATNSKTGQPNILATNITLDLLYVDPVLVDDPVLVAETLADILLTEQFHQQCKTGQELCPRELRTFYEEAFDPLKNLDQILTGALLEASYQAVQPVTDVDIIESRRRFARDIEERIQVKRVNFVPLKYGATKPELTAVENLNLPGIFVSHKNKIIYGNPELVDQSRISRVADQLAELLNEDFDDVRRILRQRPLRYVPIMHQLSPELSNTITELLRKSAQQTARRRAEAARDVRSSIRDPLWSIALLPEHWRIYPDDTVASHVIGFVNNLQEAQYGIERRFNPELSGQVGLIKSVIDLQQGHILTAQQQIIDPEDGDTIVLTIDRYIQGEVEKILDEAVKKFDADSGQVIIIEPTTGRVLALANAPLFNSNNYSTVYELEPIYLPPDKQAEIVVELYHPETRKFIVKGFRDQIFTQLGREELTENTHQEIAAVEKLYDLADVVRYYIYIGENSRRELFPTAREDVWLKYRNNIGVGAYLNRAIQEIYEPGSVLKPITMAVAIDQGEITPSDTYDDNEPVKVDEYTIRNALNKHFGTVTMTQCLEYSVNTCMTTVSTKLGRKLFHRALTRFGLGQITGIELEDELPGEILPWRKWSMTLLATAAYGQGISATPMQVVMAIGAIANDGRLMRPNIIDRVEKFDGKITTTKPHVVDQVVTAETAATVTAMMVSAVSHGYAKPAKVAGYRIAGKTGTSQIAGPGGKYETGTGAGITSFAGFAPIDDPKFVMLVKIDRPRNVQYGAESAAPVFKQIATFLFDYYGIPPDEK